MKTLIQANYRFSESSLQRYIEKISNANSKQELFSLCSTIAEDFKTSYFTYILRQPNDFHNLKYPYSNDMERLVK